MRVALYPAVTIAVLAGAAFGQPPSWQVVLLQPPGPSGSKVMSIQSDRQFGYVSQGGGSQAGYWMGTPESWTPLAAAGQYSVVYGSDAVQQVGQLSSHAALWQGTPLSHIDLHPPGAFSSGLGSVAFGMQVGAYSEPIAGIARAGLWRGTAESFVDLHPLGASESSAQATDGTRQGGYVIWPGSGGRHAVLWSGSAQSVADLNPPSGWSELRGMAPGVQVGWARFNAVTRAALWRGSAASFVDLNPPGGTWSEFYDTNGSVHVGILPQGSLMRAAVNFGTPTSWVPLHQFLPARFTGTSAALSVYQAGPTVYVGGWAGASNNNEAILWIGTLPCYANCDQSTSGSLLTANDFMCFINRYASGDGYANCDGSTGMPALTGNDFLCFINAYAAQCP